VFPQTLKPGYGPAETETSSKTQRPRLKTWSLRPRLETSKFVYFALLTWNFFKFMAFFRRVLFVSYLQIQKTKNRWITQILINHFFAIFKVSRPETFETETCKNGSRDRDQVSRLHHWYTYYLGDPHIPFTGSIKRFVTVWLHVMTSWDLPFLVLPRAP